MIITNTNQMHVGGEYYYGDGPGAAVQKLTIHETNGDKFKIETRQVGITWGENRFDVTEADIQRVFIDRYIVATSQDDLHAEIKRITQSKIDAILDLDKDALLYWALCQAKSFSQCDEYGDYDVMYQAEAALEKHFPDRISE